MLFILLSFQLLPIVGEFKEPIAGELKQPRLLPPGIGLTIAGEFKVTNELIFIAVFQVFIFFFILYTMQSRTKASVAQFNKNLW